MVVLLKSSVLGKKFIFGSINIISGSNSLIEAFFAETGEGAAVQFREFVTVYNKKKIREFSGNFCKTTRESR